MTVEEKALALVNEVRAERRWGVIDLANAKKGYGFCFKALCRAIELEQAAIEAHEADKKAFSDAVKEAQLDLARGEILKAFDALKPFILPEPEPDPLVEAVRDTGLFTGYADTLRQAIEAHGGKIVWEQEQ